MNREAPELSVAGLRFWRLVARSLSVKRPQAVVAIGALTVGAAVTAMLLNLYGDVQRGMSREFRAYGANVVLTRALDAAAGAPMGTAGGASAATEGSIPVGVIDEAIMSRLESFGAGRYGFEAAPLLFVVMRLRRTSGGPRLPEFEDTVATGTDFSALRRVFPSWRIEGSSANLAAGTCMVGAHVAARLRLGVGDTFELHPLPHLATTGEEHAGECRIAGVVSTGSSEDDQVFVPLQTLQRAAGLEGKISMVELSVPGEPQEIERAMGEMARAIPRAEVRPVREIVYSEGNVLGSIRWLTVWLTALILIIIALSVAATMTAIVLQRRRDVAVMKALGASDRALMGLFLAEGAGLGLLGGCAGFALGALLARQLVHQLFGTEFHMVFWSFPAISLSSMLLALAATVFPVRIVRRIEPATVLRGE